MNNMELETDIEALDMEMGEITIHYCPVIPNPEGEPTAELKTADIEGTIYKIVDEEARTELENKVDKVEGKDLSTNDYTDEDKAIVDGVTTALDGKVDKDGDKVLSDNNYSDTDKAIVDGVTEALNGKADKSDTYTKSEVNSALDDKVDKVGGKGLSSNDYTDEEKAKVGEIDNKLDKTETAVNSNGLVIATPVTDTAPYIYRQTPVKESFKALMKKIVGASVVWNEILQNVNFASTDNWLTTRGTLSVANNVGTYTITEIGSSATQNRLRQAITGLANHKYMISCEVNSPHNSTFTFMQVQGTTAIDSKAISITSGKQTVKTILAPSSAFNEQWFCIDCRSGFETNEQILFKNIYLVDLTAMFGTTIADYVYTLEQATAESGIAWLQSYGFFTEDYYAYKQNKLESGCVSAHKTYDGETLLTNTELSPITLRGLFKLSTDKLTVDGDEYNADGSVTRKYGVVNLGDLWWTYDTTYQRFYASVSELKVASARTLQLVCANYISVFNSESMANVPDKSIYQGSTNINVHDSAYVGQTAEQFKTAMNGVYVIYPLAIPTTEQTTPFTETEIVGSTEKFIDYEVAQGNRDVAIPVGTETDFYQEMKLPSLPTTSGNHNLIYNPSTGFGWS